MYYTRLGWYKLSPDYSTVVRGGNNALVEEFGKGGPLDRLLGRGVHRGPNFEIIKPYMYFTHLPWYKYVPFTQLGYGTHLLKSLEKVAFSTGSLVAGLSTESVNVTWPAR